MKAKQTGFIKNIKNRSKNYAIFKKYVLSIDGLVPFDVNLIMFCNIISIMWDLFYICKSPNF